MNLRKLKDPSGPSIKMSLAEYVASPDKQCTFRVASDSSFITALKKR
jgi:hypothetical protein